MTYAIEFDDGDFKWLEGRYIDALDYAESVADGRLFTIEAYYEGDFYEIES